MASGISQIRARAAVLIEAATPDTDPGLPFVEADYHERLEELDAPLSRAEATRQFHVLAQPILSVRGAGSACTVVTQPLVVRVRYDLAGFDDRARLHELTTRIYGDQARIARALRAAPLGQTWAGVGHLETIELASATPFAPVPGRDGIVIAETRFRAAYRLE